MNMNYMNMNMILIIIIFSYHLLLMTIPTAFSDDTTGDKSIVVYCPSNITLNPDYSQSRNDLLEDLLVNTSKNNGFWITTLAIDINNRVYGIASCRRDLSRDDCQACLNSTTSEVNNSCANSTEAIIYHDHCLMRYSNIDFFGKIPSGSVFIKPDYSSLPVDTDSFTSTTKDLLGILTTEASPKENKKETDPLFAYGNKTTGSETVYAMVQCTKDVWRDCDACLENAIANLPKSPRPFPIGERVLYARTCVVRYEKYPFIKEKK